MNAEAATTSVSVRPAPPLEPPSSDGPARSGPVPSDETSDAGSGPLSSSPQETSEEVSAQIPQESPPSAAPVAPAFSAFLAQGQARRKTSRARSLTVTASVLLHAAVVVVFLARSYWKVEELSGPAVTVSFLSVPTAVPPPPPPPAKKREAHSEARAKTKPVPRPPTEQTIVQPRETPPEAAAASAEGFDKGDAEAGESGGVEGGVAGGVLGGVTHAAVAPALPKPAGPDPATRDRLLRAYLREKLGPRIKALFRYPAEAEDLGLQGRVLVRIVVDASGRLQGLTVEGACPHSLLCEDAQRTVRAAAPFPPPPPELGGTVQVQVPFNYQM